MYCVSIGIKDFNKAIEVIQDYEMAEIRLDLCDFSTIQVKEIFSSHENLIATYRKNREYRMEERENDIKVSIVRGAKWLDLDMEHNSNKDIKELKRYCNKHNTKLILSVHNYEKTPGKGEIEEYIDKAKSLGADIIKLVFYSNNEKDNDRVLSLYDNNNNIVAFNMGEIGKETRVKALILGAPFTYVALTGTQTAPGQMTIDDMKKYPYPIK